MNTENALPIAKKLGDKVHEISPINRWMSSGTSGREAILLSLRKSCGLMLNSLVTNKSKQAIYDAFSALSSDLNSAIITGIISESESVDYQELLEELRANIDKEK